MPIVDRDPAGYVRTAIQSLQRQTYPTIEIHLMLSGPLSPEAESVIAESAGDTRVHLYRVAERRPVGVNLNGLLDQTLGRFDYYARMDSDDESLPSRIAVQLEYMESHPEVDALGSAVIDFDELGRELKYVRYPLAHHDIVRQLRKRTPMAHPTVFFRPSFFAKAGRYPPRPLEDGLYWMRAITRGCRFANLAEPLVRLRRSDAMLRRRSGLRTNWEELKIRITINRTLRFGPSAYVYGLAAFGVQMSPLWLKKILYDRLR